MPALTNIPSVKFDILLPASYFVPESSEQKFVQLTEVADHLAELTRKYERYGGYTMSNPYAPPPYAGGFQDEPQERTYWLMLIFPDHLLHEAWKDVEGMIRFFQETYVQTEILAYCYSVTRYMPI